MGFTRWWSRWVPGLRHWFSGSAFLGLLLTGYNVLIGIIGIAPITDETLKWSLLFIGFALTCGIWYSLARDQERGEKREIALYRRLDELPDQVLERSTDLKDKLTDALTKLAQVDGKNAEALAARMIEYEKIREAFREVFQAHDAASEYGKMAADTIRDIGKIIAGSAAEANEVEVLLGLPLTGDPEYHKNMSTDRKVELIWLRTHLYHRERVKKIGKDNALALDKLTQPSQPSAPSSEALPPTESAS